MFTQQPTLHLLCGKVASGKSTLARKLASQPGTVLISEDEWLATLYGPEMSSVSDYVRYAGRLEAALEQHVVALLRAGMSVVLDFHANTIARRDWMRGIFQSAQAAHRLHFLDVSDETCLSRLRRRNADGEHPFSVTESQFARLSKHFVSPSPEEGFDIVRYPSD